MKTLSLTNYLLSNGSKTTFLLSEIYDVLYIEDDAGAPAVIDLEFAATETPLLKKGLTFTVVLEKLKNAHTLTIFGYLVTAMVATVNSKIDFYYNGITWKAIVTADASEIIPDWTLEADNDILTKTATGLQFLP